MILEIKKQVLYGDLDIKFIKGHLLRLNLRGITNISQVEGEIWKSKSYDITINFNINEIFMKKELIK